MCRIRYEYALSRIVEDEEHWDHKTIDCHAHKRITFWTKVAEETIDHGGNTGEVLSVYNYSDTNSVEGSVVVIEVAQIDYY